MEIQNPATETLNRFVAVCLATEILWIKDEVGTAITNDIVIDFIPKKFEFMRIYRRTISQLSGEYLLVRFSPKKNLRISYFLLINA